jgi:hypothetical protein
LHIPDFLKRYIHPRQKSAGLWIKTLVNPDFQGTAYYTYLRIEATVPGEGKQILRTDIAPEFL